MEYMTLNNGVQMPLVGLGTWNLRGQECIESVKSAIDCGYRLIDTAQMYDNEVEVGKGIIQSGIDRKELFITTKIYGNSNSYEKCKKAIQLSLKNLQVDYIDLLLLHEPYSHEIDMYRALEEAYQQGLVRAIGISNYHGHRYEKFMQSCSIIPAINQVECHVYFQKWQQQKQFEEAGIKMQAWSPLACRERNIEKEEVLQALANKYHKTVYQIVLRFLIQRGISVIPKSKHVTRLKENMDLFDFSLSDEDIEQIKTIDNNKTLFPWTEMF